MQAGILRKNPNINWNKDRGKDVTFCPWYKLGLTYGRKGYVPLCDLEVTSSKGGNCCPIKEYIIWSTNRCYKQFTGFSESLMITGCNILIYRRLFFWQSGHLQLPESERMEVLTVLHPFKQQF